MQTPATTSQAMPEAAASRLGAASEIRPSTDGQLRLKVTRWAAVACALLVLGVTFLAYLSPHLAVDLANRLWACF
jgi:hypothetical protein